MKCTETARSYTTLVTTSVGNSTIATTPSQTSIENSQTVDTTIISTVEVANGIGASTVDRALGVDAGALHQVAVRSSGVPAQRLAHEPADDLVRVGLGDVPHHDARVRTPDDDARSPARRRCR